MQALAQVATPAAPGQLIYTYAVLHPHYGEIGTFTGYSALAIDQPALSALSLLLLAPVCALAGLWGGTVLGLRMAPATGEDTLP